MFIKHTLYFRQMLVISKATFARSKILQMSWLMPSCHGSEGRGLRKEIRKQGWTRERGVQRTERIFRRRTTKCMVGILVSSLILPSRSLILYFLFLLVSDSSLFSHFYYLGPFFMRVTLNEHSELIQSCETLASLPVLFRSPVPRISVARIELTLSVWNCAIWKTQYR